MREDLVTFIILLVVITVILFLTVRGVRRYRRVESIRRAIMLYSTQVYFSDWPVRVRLVDITQGTIDREKHAFVTVDETGIFIHDIAQDMYTTSIHPFELRWFGRTRNYQDGYNEIWLHVEKDELWKIFRIRMQKSPMQRFVRALKMIAPQELVEAYRRRRPYIHQGPVTAYPAFQDIHGAWILSESVKLFLMPLMLVQMEWGHVAKTFDLADMHAITAVKRLDNPSAPGLLRFRFLGEDYAFSLEKHEHFAEQVALAARRRLEDPQILKGKKALEDDEAYENWIESADMPQMGDFIFIEKS